MTTIKAEQVPLLSQTTQLTKLYIFQYDGVTWTFLGLLLEIVKVASLIGVALHNHPDLLDGYIFFFWN